MAAQCVISSIPAEEREIVALLIKKISCYPPSWRTLVCFAHPEATSASVITVQCVERHSHNVLVNVLVTPPNALH